MDDRLSQSVVYYSVRTMHFHSTTAPMACAGSSKASSSPLSCPRRAGPMESERSEMQALQRAKGCRPGTGGEGRVAVELRP
jgi:hypothetical protein